MVAEIFRMYLAFEVEWDVLISQRFRKFCKVVKPKFLFSKSLWVTHVCFELCEIVIILLCIVKADNRVHKFLSAVCCVCGWDEVLTCSVVYICRLYKVCVRQHTRYDEAILFDDRQWNITYKNCSDESAGRVLLSFMVEIGKNFYNIQWTDTCRVYGEDEYLCLWKTCLNIGERIPLQ